MMARSTPPRATIKKINELKQISRDGKSQIITKENQTRRNKKTS